MNLTRRRDSSISFRSVRLHVRRVTGLRAAEVGHAHPGLIFVPDLIDGLPAGLHASHGRFDLAPAQVVELGQVEDDAKAAHREHEDEEHGLLRGPGHVTLHLLDARVAIALVHRGHVESVQEVLAHQKADFQSVSEHDLNDVEPRDALLASHFRLDGLRARAEQLFGLQAVGLGLLGGVVRVGEYSVHDGVLDLLVLELLSFQRVLLFVVHRQVDGGGGVAPLLGLRRLMDRVRDETQTGRAHHYDLKYPISDVRYGESLVVTRLVTARLQGVAHEHGLLVVVHRLTHYSHD